ncbi:MAG: response regulator transcription factor [Pigmentiphaga sp.]|uniref:helix-turn-helix transcriptional regulator n=1 Tax=Pigmentiphaga sp. TaxID=1977564 RepID=UPI003B53282C
MMKETTRVHSQELSDLLLDLYSACHELAMSAFLPHALSSIKRRLPFDSAWWAMTTLVDDQYKFHASYVEGLPQNMHLLWLSIQQDDVVGKAFVANPDQTLNFTPDQVDSTKGSRWLARTTGFRHVLCTVNVKLMIAQRHFLALSRHDDRHAFSESERCFKELLMPHLNSMLDINRMTELRRLHAQGSEQRQPMAVVDRLGAIHHAEAAFMEQIKRQWPRWWGPRVPAPVLDLLLKGETSHAAPNIMVQWFWVGDLAVMELSPRSPQDALSRRELEVAKCFAGGASYKEVAQSLGLAPATVRHHLRVIYGKLEISDKAALVRKCNSDGGAAL